MHADNARIVPTQKIITNKISDVNVFISNSRSIITYRRR